MRRFFSWFFSFLIVFFTVCTFRSLLQLDKINRDIREFTKRGVFQSELSTPLSKVYFVKSEDDLSDDLTYYRNNNGTFYPGGIGDIVLTKKLSFDLPFIKDILCFYIGGHAVIASKDYEVIEAVGVGGRNGIVYHDKGLFNFYYDEYMAYRVKVPREIRELAYTCAQAYIGQPYNYSFIFDCHNKKYCSDLVSYAYLDAGVEFYNNFLATTVLDLAANPYVELTYYSNMENNVRSTYILTNF